MYPSYRNQMRHITSESAHEFRSFRGCKNDPPPLTWHTVDHAILMEVLKRRFGVEGNALSWLAEFLHERSQVVRVCESESDSLPLHFGVPQGSVLGSKRFIEYTEDVDDLFVRHGVCHHLFADDLQGFRSGHPSDISVIITVVEDCLSDVSSWSATKRLQVSVTKTDILWFGSETNLRKVLPANRDISVGQSVIQPVTVVRDLGVLTDGELSMRQHVTRLSQTCFFHLRRLRSLASITRA